MKFFSAFLLFAFLASVTATARAEIDAREGIAFFESRVRPALAKVAKKSLKSTRSSTTWPAGVVPCQFAINGTRLRAAAWRVSIEPWRVRICAWPQ